jgi:hypothetical protein
MSARRTALFGWIAMLLGVSQALAQVETKEPPSVIRERRLDPNKFFDSLTQGKDVWIRSEDSNRSNSCPRPAYAGTSPPLAP